MAKNDGNGDSKLDTVINSMIVLIVGTIILCSCAIPIVSGQIGSLSDLITEGQILDIASYQTLLGVALVMAILGLVLGIIKMYTGRSDR